jgi:polysaccharide pyruvyl transferase WcaK-like protein
MRKNIFHITPVGQGYNIGNYAISYSVRALIRKVHPLCNIITIPAFGDQNCGLTKNIIHQANQSGSSILVGGGNLIENNELNVDVNALESLKVPLVLFSLSRGDIYNNNLEFIRRTDVMPNEIIKALHRSASSSIARDDATYNYYKSIGIENSEMGGCPTIFMDKWFDEKFYQLSDQDNVSYISIRNPNQMNIPLKRQLLIPKLITEIHDTLRENGHKNIMMLCHDQRDISFAESIEGIGFYYTSDIYEYLSLIKMARIVVSMRVHSSLPSAALGTPFINISYDQRGVSLMSSIGLEAWDINLIHCNDIQYEVVQRLGTLENISNIISDNDDLWNKLYERQYEAIKLL